MPLHKADDSIDPYTLRRVPERFVIFYSSITTENGQMWCPVNTPSSLALPVADFYHFLLGM